MRQNGTSARRRMGRGPTTTARQGLGKENDEKNQAFLKDNWDDTDGYYCAKLGERLDEGTKSPKPISAKVLVPF